MSKIQAELSELFEIKPTRGQSRPEFIAALMLLIADAPDKDWDAMSKPAQDWYNKAADAKNQNKPIDEIPDFPDLEKEEEKEQEPATRRRAPAKANDERLTKVGDVATVLTKRGKSVTGKVVKIDDEEIVIVDKDGEEQDFDMSRVESVSVQHGDAGKEAAAEKAAYEPKLKDVVTITNKRGKVFTGKIVELDKEVVVLDVDGKDEEIDRDRIETIVPAGAKEEEKEQEPATRRRGSASADKEKEKDKEADGEGKRTRTSNEGVSIGLRIKEIIAEDLDISEADLIKQLKKEGLDFKENTVNLNYKDCMKFVVVLRAAKLLK